MIESCVAVRTAWTGLSGAIGLLLLAETLRANEMERPWFAMACVAVWLFLFAPSVGILIVSNRSVEAAARSILLYDAAVLALLLLATLLVHTLTAALWFGGIVCLVGGLLAVEVAQARQELAHDPDAWQRAVRYWVAALAVVWLVALLRVVHHS
jgi:hypothetical protein